MTGTSFFKGDRILEILSIPSNSRSEYETLELLELTYPIRFFSKLREQHSNIFHQKCCQVLCLEKFSKNQYIYQKGDQSIKYYVLLQGEISLLKTKRVVIDASNSSESDSEELEEDYGLNNQKSRFKALVINPEIVFELSRFAEIEENKNKSISILNKDLLEKESQELMDLILQASGPEDSEKEIKLIKPGGDFGQEALFPAKLRNFHAVAKTQVILASLHKITFKKIIHEIAIERVMNMLGFLSKVSLFSRWSKTSLARVLNLFKLKSLKKGQYLFYQNDTASSVYFVIKGNFAISKNCSRPLTQESFSGPNNLKNFSPNKKKKLIKLELVIKGEYEILGAEEVLNGVPVRVFSCLCNSAIGEVYEVSKSDFEKLLVPETQTEFTSTLKVNSLWLKTRSESLEQNQSIFESFELKPPETKPLNFRRNSATNNFFDSQKKSSIHYPVGQIQPLDILKTPSQRVSWNSCETSNIHLVSIKRNNPRLAPASFMQNLKTRRCKRPENRSFDYSLFRNDIYN